MAETITGTPKENQLVKLEFLSGQFETMDQFAEMYESMLTECKESGDTETAAAMQTLLLKQSEYLMNLWLQEKQAMSPMLLNEYGKNN